MLTKLADGKEYPYFPLNYYIVSGDTSTINTIAETAIFEKIIISDGSVIGEERISDSMGKYFTQKVSFTLPKINVSTSQFLNGFLFKRNLINSSSIARPINIDAYNTCVIFKDNNDQWWILGYDSPFKITSFEIDNNNDNAYKIELTSSSYTRIRSIVNTWSCSDTTITF